MNESPETVTRAVASLYHLPPNRDLFGLSHMKHDETVNVFRTSWN